jgi:splicing factor 45
MSNSSTPGQPPRSGLSLYANLLDPTGDAHISRGPVVFKNAAADPAEETSSKRHQIDAGETVHLPSLVQFAYRC